MDDPLFLGVDLGSSSLKCGLFNLMGGCAGAVRVGYPTREWEGGAEQRCGDWWQALNAGFRRATAGVDLSRIVAIGVGGHAPSPVIVDSRLRAVSPVLPWFDGRSRAYRDRLIGELGRAPEHGAERLMVQWAARALWLRDTEPAAFSRAACILHSGDYLVARLTGRRVMTSPRVSAIFAKAGLPLSLLPETECRPGERAGEILPEIARAWELGAAVPVIAGGLDSFLGTVGSGLREPGDACINTGSSAVVAVLDRPGRIGRFEWAGYPIQSRPTFPGGRILPVARRSNDPDGSSTDRLREAARQSPPARILRPLVGRLRDAKRDDGEIRDWLAESAQQATPSEMDHLRLVAVFRGQRDALEELERKCGPVSRVRAVGGLAALPELNQLQADVLGRVVEVPRITDSGVLGAAMLAATELEICTPREASSRMVTVERFAVPRGEIAPAYEELFEGISSGACALGR